MTPVDADSVSRALPYAQSDVTDDRLTAVAGALGIHMEGPHLSVSRKGAHDADLIRPMNDDDLRLLVSAAERLPNVTLTVAPENTTIVRIRTMSEAGIIVSLGQTDASYDTCMAAFEAVARCVT